MNVAAGLLAGRGGLPFFVGGVLAWWIVAPCRFSWMGRKHREHLRVLANYTEEAISDGTPVFGALYGSMIRPLGIGTLIGGALMGVIVSFPAIKCLCFPIQCCKNSLVRREKSGF